MKVPQQLATKLYMGEWTLNVIFYLVFPDLFLIEKFWDLKISFFNKRLNLTPVLPLNCIFGFLGETASYKWHILNG